LLFVLEINVFIGARSELNSSDWKWQNGTKVTEYSYGSAPHGCRQMSLPLSYEKNQIDLVPKLCDHDGNTAYFICEADCKNVE